jgi:hypothetical protein
MNKNLRFTLFIFIAMIAGAILGIAVHQNASPEFIASFAEKIKLLSTNTFICIGMRC